MNDQHKKLWKELKKKVVEHEVRVWKQRAQAVDEMRVRVSSNVIRRKKGAQKQEDKLFLKPMEY